MSADGLTKFSELGLFKRLEFPGKDQHLLVDVGAHIGSFSRTFAREGWGVIAFEPESNNYRELCNNVEGFPEVQCIQKAVSNIAGKHVPFYVSPEHWAIHSLKPFHPTHQPTQEVDTVRLDERLAEMGIRHVTLLKIDIEGADFLALKSFDFDKFQPEAVMCEFMDERSKENFGYTHHDMVAYMDDKDYVTFVSEWSSFVEYARKNGSSISPKFLRCVRYQPVNNPSFGNLIFVRKENVKWFERTLHAYLREIKRPNWIQHIHTCVKKVPGTVMLYHILRRVRQKPLKSGRYFNCKY
jgi:FkbM family methyltransferase